MSNNEDQQHELGDDRNENTRNDPRSKNQLLAELQEQKDMLWALIHGREASDPYEAINKAKVLTPYKKGASNSQALVDWLETSELNIRRFPKELWTLPIGLAMSKKDPKLNAFFYRYRADRTEAQLRTATAYDEFKSEVMKRFVAFDQAAHYFSILANRRVNSTKESFENVVMERRTAIEALDLPDHLRAPALLAGFETSTARFEVKKLYPQWETMTYEDLCEKLPLIVPEERESEERESKRFCAERVQGGTETTNDNGPTYEQARIGWLAKDRGPCFTRQRAKRPADHFFGDCPHRALLEDTPKEIAQQRESSQASSARSLDYPRLAL